MNPCPFCHCILDYGLCSSSLAATWHSAWSVDSMESSLDVKYCFQWQEFSSYTLAELKLEDVQMDTSLRKAAIITSYYRLFWAYGPASNSFFCIDECALAIRVIRITSLSHHPNTPPLWLLLLLAVTHINLFPHHFQVVFCNVMWGQVPFLRVVWSQ